MSRIGFCFGSPSLSACARRQSVPRRSYVAQRQPRAHHGAGRALLKRPTLLRAQTLNPNDGHNPCHVSALPPPPARPRATAPAAAAAPSPTLLASRRHAMRRALLASLASLARGGTHHALAPPTPGAWPAARRCGTDASCIDMRCSGGVARSCCQKRQLLTCSCRAPAATAALAAWRCASTAAPQHALTPLLLPLEPHRRTGVWGGWAHDALPAAARRAYAKGGAEPPRTGQTPPPSVAGLQRGGVRIVMFSPNVRARTAAAQLPDAGLISSR